MKFTLLEVLVALVVIAVIIPIAMGALMSGSKVNQAAIAREQAAHLADLKLQEMVVTGDWMDAGNSGDFGDDYPGYTWELTDDEWTELAVTMRQLSLTVTGPTTAISSRVTLTTLVAEPAE